MYHFFSEHEHIHDTYIDIVGSDVNHIKNVLRLKTGDSLLISSGDNIDYTCHIAQIDEEHIRADIDSVDERGRELASKIYLFQGLPKSDKLELIIQKAVELGAARIIPVAMKRSVVKLDDKKAAAKLSRWNAISESAAKQSKRSVIPQVGPVMNYKDALKQASGCDICFVPYENENGMAETRKLVSAIRPQDSVAVFIGPEGGFENDEIAAAKELGMHTVTLGKRILRTETAGMAFLSMLAYALEDQTEE